MRLSKRKSDDADTYDHGRFDRNRPCLGAAFCNEWLKCRGHDAQPAGSDLTGENTRVTALDVTYAMSISEAVAAGMARFGRIEALVNIAGYGACGPLEAFATHKPVGSLRRMCLAFWR